MEELEEIQKLAQVQRSYFHAEVLSEINFRSNTFPIWSFTLGSRNPEHPSLGLYAGVHGLERIGTHVVIGYLQSLLAQLEWDEHLLKTFETFRLVSIPLINPAGMAYLRRSNPNGVDLMRNAPVKAAKGSKQFLVSGHQFSNKLPWFQGAPEAAMEKEAQVLFDFVTKEQLTSRHALSIDFHSGFGLRDRLWYPFSKSREPFPKQAEVDRMISLFNKTMPHHIYLIEPQHHSYIIEGDLWDYLFLEQQKNQTLKSNCYIPWTLEMGSWNWVKKNPYQLFSMDGLFNPVKDHRFSRTMRRHILLIDFFRRILRNPQSWSNSVS